MKQNLPIIALVGSPNAGKSTLLNKIAGERLAVTADQPGTTRDRLYAETYWNGRHFLMVDTAGLSYGLEDLEQSLHEQVEVAIAEADAIWVVVDGKQPVFLDQRIEQILRKTKKPVTLVVNKVDAPHKEDLLLGEFAKLGMPDMRAVSALTGYGVGDLLDRAVEIIDSLPKAPPIPSHGPGVSLIGKPNVGKSSLLNQILGENRAIVSPIPGTTRTPVDSPIEINGQPFTLIDTAGLKKRGERQSQADQFSAIHTMKSIHRSDVCILVIDATEEITKQDQILAREILDRRKGLMVWANKFDAYVGEEKELRAYISQFFPFVRQCPLFFVSAVTGHGIKEALAKVTDIEANRRKEASAEEVSAVLQLAMKQNPPKLLRDQKKPKVHGLRQVDSAPPVFVLEVNHPAAISMQFRKYLEKLIISELGFWGTPVLLRLQKSERQ